MKIHQSNPVLPYVTKRDDVTFIEHASWKFVPLDAKQGKSWGQKLINIPAKYVNGQDFLHLLWLIDPFHFQLCYAVWFREHRQNIFVTLSVFWPLTGVGEEGSDVSIIFQLLLNPSPSSLWSLKQKKEAVIIRRS